MDKGIGGGLGGAFGITAQLFCADKLWRSCRGLDTTNTTSYRHDFRFILPGTVLVLLINLPRSNNQAQI
jgi:hypothetical protein